MAFAGHARSLDLSYTSSGTAYIGNVHPDRHRHIISDQTSPKRAGHGAPNRSKSYSAQQEVNKEIYGRNQGDDAPPNKVSFHDAMALGTDDMGNTPTRSLWIGNVPAGLTDDALRMAFGKYGPILSVRATPSKHCGFVNFEMVDSAIDAWRECHETDIFDTGVTIYVRYEKPPSWLKDKHPSLKRKRSSGNSLGSFPDDSLKRPIPTGPRSQVPHGIPPSGPKSQQTSISPPPLRRHDTYRPHVQSEEDRTARKAGERHRQNDLYRPSYGDDGETAPTEKRSSIHTRDEHLPRDRIYAQTSPVGTCQPANAGLARSPSPSASSLHSSNRENAVSSLGIGIKGLAASRKESYGDDRRSGLLIKGAAAQNRTAVPDILGTSPPRNVATSRKSLPNGKAPYVPSHPVRRPRSLSPEQAQIEPDLLKADLSENIRASGNATFPVGSSSSRNIVATVKETTDSKGLTNGVHHFEDETKEAQPLPILKDKLGFTHLSYLFDIKEKEDMAAQKARTISPFSRLRASSRETTSVASAKTDPTPIHKPRPSTVDACDKCKVGGSFLKLFKCAVPSCFRRIHSMCGNPLSSTDFARSEKKINVTCDECLRIYRMATEILALDDPMKAPIARHNRSMAPDDVEEVVPPHNNKNVRCQDREVTYSFVSIGSATIAAHSSAEGMVASHDAHQLLSNKAPQNVNTASQSQLGSGEKAASHQKVTQIMSEQEPISNPPTQPVNLPPTEPRLMREGDVDEEALEISIRYKESVTCPWWKKGNKCVRLEKDCMFAHHLTGIESPNGRSTAKDWTCFDFRTSLGCRYSEKDCLYSHRDTGLYVGLDGKASKKHLECYWWRYNGRCTFSDSSCTCAHYPTGLVAEEPMPRDTVRRAPHQPSTVSPQDADTSMDLQARSPSYSPPPPPPTATSDSLFVAQWPLQLLSEQTLHPLQNQDDHMTPRLNSGRAAQAVVDPRLKRNMDSGSQSQQFDCQTNSGSAQAASLKPNRKPALEDEDSPRVDSHVNAQQSKQRAMNSCKNCSKLVFKAEVCTDCLKLSQRRDSERTSTTEHATSEQKLDGSSIVSTLKATDTVFAVPAPKVLKRSRTGSSSNLFASKRMRPDMTALRSSTSQSSAMSNGVKISHPPTLEQLNRINAKKRAKENGAATDGHSPIVETSIEKENAVSPPRPIGRAPTFSPFTILESPNEVSQRSPIFEDHMLKSSRPTIDEQVQSDTIEVLCEAYGELEHIRSRSESPESNCDSDTPLAELRNRGDKPLWSSSTSNQSPQESRNALKIAANRVASVLSGQSAPAGPAARCRTCVKYHRKCVHNNTTGELDDRKCYNWQQDRIRLGIKHKAHYSEPERDAIRKRASQYAAALHDIREAPEAGSDDDEPDVLDEDDVCSSSSDEIQKPHSKSSKIVYQGPMLRSPIGSSTAESRSQTPEARPAIHQPSLADVKIAGNDVQSAALLDDQETADAISRLKAKGAVFESDSDDDMDYGYDIEASVDKRIDPLLYHKQKNALLTPPLKLPSITKGQGLKIPHLIYRRQMMRNFQIFGDPHKEVDRKIQQQEVLAIVEKRDPEDILALPKKFENKITFQEFLGLQKDKEIESCLGKVSLPRGKFTMGLAFREKDIDPGLGAWGRERRGNRKERPVYVVGM